MQGVEGQGSMSLLYDISRTIAPTSAVWPGDAPLTLTHALRKAEGASVNLTTITLSPHIGSHADAPYHFNDHDLHPAHMPLEPFLGPAHVVTVRREHGGITPQDLAAYDLRGVQRLLLHTWVSELPDHEWPQDFPYPTVELVDWLAEQGAVLLGVDSPSVDRFESQTLPVHHRLRQRGLFHLETLRLAGVPDGLYELIALPLKLAHACASPVRAVLRPLPKGAEGNRSRQEL